MCVTHAKFAHDPSNKLSDCEVLVYPLASKGVAFKFIFLMGIGAWRRKIIITGCPHYFTHKSLLQPSFNLNFNKTIRR